MAPTPSSAAAAADRRRSEYLEGIALLMIVVILWTASNFLTNTVLTSGYDKPFAVTYANTSSFALYLVPFFASKRLRNQFSRRNRGFSPAHQEQHEQQQQGWLRKLGFFLPANTTFDSERGAYKPIPTEASGLTARAPLSPVLRARRISATSTGEHRPLSLSLSLGTSAPARAGASAGAAATLSAPPSSIDGRRPRTEILVRDLPPAVLPPLTLRQTALLACQFTLVWFGANWSINAGLGLTSVASGTTIGSASGFFTLALGAVLGVDHFTLGRLGAVSMSFIGVVMVTWADAGATLSPRSLSADPPSPVGTHPANAPLGDMLALLSAFLYSIYVMLLKIKIGSEDRISMPLMFGIVGAFNILALWPIGLLLHLTGLEPFELPSDPATWAGVLVNMGITLVSDLVYLMAMLKSSPLASTLGLSLTIPLAVAGDILRGSHSGGTQAALGSILVLASFVAIGLADNAAMKQAEEQVHARLNSPSTDSLALTSDAGSATTADHDDDDYVSRGRQ